jgi:hypothetical protein
VFSFFGNPKYTVHQYWTTSNNRTRSFDQEISVELPLLPFLLPDSFSLSTNTQNLNLVLSSFVILSTPSSFPMGISPPPGDCEKQQTLQWILTPSGEAKTFSELQEEEGEGIEEEELASQKNLGVYALFRVPKTWHWYNWFGWSLGSLLTICLIIGINIVFWVLVVGSKVRPFSSSPLPLFQFLFFFSHSRALSPHSTLPSLSKESAPLGRT